MSSPEEILATGVQLAVDPLDNNECVACFMALTAGWPLKGVMGAEKLSHLYTESPLPGTQEKRMLKQVDEALYESLNTRVQAVLGSKP